MEAALANESLREGAYGGVLRRLVAYTLDCVLLLLGLAVLQALLLAVNPIYAGLRAGNQPTPTQISIWVFATATIPFILYFALTLRSTRQATFGMRLLKLRVADVNGKRLGLGQALLRSAVMLAPFELNHALMFHLAPRNAPPTFAFYAGIAMVWGLIAIYIAAILLTRRHQSVHDLLAGTVVQRVV